MLVNGCDQKTSFQLFFSEIFFSFDVGWHPFLIIHGCVKAIKKIFIMRKKKQPQFNEPRLLRIWEKQTPQGPRSKDQGGIEPGSKRPAWPQQPNLYRSAKELHWWFDSWVWILKTGLEKGCGRGGEDPNSQKSPFVESELPLYPPPPLLSLPLSHNTVRVQFSTSLLLSLSLMVLYYTTSLHYITLHCIILHYTILQYLN